MLLECPSYLSSNFTLTINGLSIKIYNSYIFEKSELKQNSDHVPKEKQIKLVEERMLKHVLICLGICKTLEVSFLSPTRKKRNMT